MPKAQDDTAMALEGLEVNQDTGEVSDPPAAKPARSRRSSSTAAAAKPAAPAIFGQIADVMSELEDITPTGEGPSNLGSYKYIKPNLLMKHLRALLSKHRIVVAPRTLNERVEITWAPAPPTWRGKIEAQRTLAVIEMEYTFFSAIDGSSMVVSATAESADVGDKALSKAITTAWKKAMSQTFLITTDQDGDVDYGDINEELEVAAEKVNLRDRGEQHREKARDSAEKVAEKRERRKAAEEPAEPVDEDDGDTRYHDEPREAGMSLDEVSAATAAETRAQAQEPPAPVAAAPSADPGSPEEMREAKKVLRANLAERNKGEKTLDQEALQALGAQVTGSTGWMKSASMIKVVAKAVKQGVEVAG